MWFVFLRSNRYKFLLTALMMCFIVLPTLYEVVNLQDIPHTHWIVVSISSLVLLVATFAVSDNRWIARVSLLLMMLTIIIEVAATWLVTSQQVSMLHHLLRVIFFAFIIAEILKRIFKPGFVTFDTISASLCVYILLGALWANFYSMSELITPGSIALATRPLNAPALPLSDMTLSFRMLYFSLATLSTVGYGDVVPVSPMTRMLAVTEAIIGQIYLLVMVSRLVGIHVAQAISPTPDQPSKP